MAIVVLIVITIAIIYFSFNPSQSRIFPRCPSLMFTGYECAGCGSQRALHHLLHLRFVEAFKMNAMLVILIPYILLAVYTDYFGGKERYRRLPQYIYSQKVILLILLLIVVFTILRNIL